MGITDASSVRLVHHKRSYEDSLMPEAMLARYVLLPELQITRVVHAAPNMMLLRANKLSAFEVCPKCATPSRSIYDHREVKVKDEPLKRNPVTLIIRKRRFYCRNCRRPFTETVPGIGKGRRFTERFKKKLCFGPAKPLATSKPFESTSIAHMALFTSRSMKF